jgi:hypothetical protein
VLDRGSFAFGVASRHHGVETKLEIVTFCPEPVRVYVGGR